MIIKDIKSKKKIKNMKIFMDTEFTGLQLDTTLISIGLITENNETFYAELTDYNEKQINDWLKENVIKNLVLQDYNIKKDYNPNSDNVKIRGKFKVIKIALEYWLNKFDKIEIWSDCLSYDWVLFNEIFGGALNIPKNIYYIPFDICTMFKLLDIDPDISRIEFSGLKDLNQHNSLSDAKMIKSCYEKLDNILKNKMKH